MLGATEEEGPSARVERAHDDTERARARAAALSMCEFACNCGVIPCPWSGWKRCPNKCGRKRAGLCKVRECVAARRGSVYEVEAGSSASRSALSTHKRPRKRSSPVSPMSRSECAGRGARCCEACACDSSTRLLRVVKSWRFLFALLLGVGRRVCMDHAPDMPV